MKSKLHCKYLEMQSCGAFRVTETVYTNLSWGEKVYIGVSGKETHRKKQSRKKTGENTLS